MSGESEPPTREAADGRADLAGEIPTLIGREEITRRVGELAGRISADYAETEELVLVGVLKGAFVFLADLARRLTVPRRIEFMALSTYDRGEQLSGAVQLLMDLRSDIRGKDVLVVEDILDTGRTLEFLMDTLAARRPASLESCVLVRKKRDRSASPDPKYLGFDIPDAWVVGYGLDYDERYRTLPYVGILPGELR